MGQRSRRQRQVETRLHDNLQVGVCFGVLIKDGHCSTDARNAKYSPVKEEGVSVWQKDGPIKARTTGNLRCSSGYTAKREPTTNSNRTQVTANLLEGRVIAFRRVPRLVPIHEDGHPVLGMPHARELHVDRTPRTLLDGWTTSMRCQPPED